MTARPTFTVTRIPRPDEGTVALIDDAVLLLAYWRRVPVRKQTTSALSRLELFVLEIAATLGGVRERDLTAITGLPGQLLAPLARRLLRAGALIPVPGGYAPAPDQAAQVFAAGRLREIREARVDLVYLPETDEMISVGDGLASIDNRRLDPTGQAPAAAEIARTPWPEFIGDRIRSHRIAGLSPDIVDIGPSADHSPLLPGDFCPVYRCNAQVRRRGPALTVELTLKGTSPRKRRGETSGLRQATISLGGADRLAAGWSAATVLPQQPADRAEIWTALLGRPGEDVPAIEQVDAITWRVHLTEASARQLADSGRDLAQSLMLRIAAEACTAHVVVELFATDPGSRALIDRDRVLAQAEWTGADLADLEKALAHLAGELPYELSGLLVPAAVRDRAWQLKRYHLAYTLRRREDFRYA
ncbi:hypothetical protein ACTOB_003317 [Actinoplanes oblitus]|uniref:Uncharacterized protein n=1 Tax=Actinoplanes oblitus TaxID=3040509 RepID=A0ABY8WS70_9ACTN|nr:hypothetical protein [Actinoplanes oblitus]WIM99657.1 hypothetical protein ACTOB_003317 [Actinoplanes oblitus]